MYYKKGLINWSEVSERLTGNKTYIRSSYTGSKHSDKVNEVIRVEKMLDNILDGE